MSPSRPPPSSQLQSTSSHPLESFADFFGEHDPDPASRAARAHTEGTLGRMSGVGGLEALAMQGSWRPLVQRTKEMLGDASAPLALPHRMVAITYHVLALTKLRMYGAAADELRGLGDLDASKYKHDGASTVPFALRYLAAELPFRLSQPQVAINALYALMNRCKVEAERARGGAEQAARWRRRQEMVLYTLLTHHLQASDFGVVLQWLERLLNAHPADVVVLSRVGCVLLQVGDVESAARAFSAAQKASAAHSDPSLPPRAASALLQRNAGLLAFARKDLAAAQEAFGRAVEADPADVISVNNYALCLMYQRNLLGATRYLEENLRADPVKYIDEALVLNLCSMYDLAWASGNDNKRVLSSWISKVAPDDFDLNCTRL